MICRFWIFQHLTVLYKKQIPWCLSLSKLSIASYLADLNYSQPFHSPWAVRKYSSAIHHSPFKPFLPSSHSREPFSSVTTAKIWPLLSCYPNAESWPDVSFRFRFSRHRKIGSTRKRKRKKSDTDWSESVRIDADIWTRSLMLPKFSDSGLWNSLPTSITKSNSLTPFCKALKNSKTSPNSDQHHFSPLLLPDLHIIGK